MTRFQKEINGLLGDYWKKQAEKDIAYYVEKATNDAYVVNGVIRWKSNNRCLMDDACEILEYANYLFSREETRKAREIDDAEFIKAYRKIKHVYSQEEICEMQNVFGSDTVIVDVISGQSIML